jgi:hypothetical protein
MQRGRLGVAALVAAGALWTQLALIPAVAALARGAPVDPAGAALGLAAFGVALAGVGSVPRRPALGFALLLAGFPAALGLFALVAGRHPLAHFDAPARWIAAATAAGFASATAAWAGRLAPRFPTEIAPSDPQASRAPAPPLRRPAFAALALVATAVTVVMPALIAARAPQSRADRLWGEALARARVAVTAAGGLAIGALLVLGLGGALLRGRAVRSRRTARALVYCAWAMAVAVLAGLLDRRTWAVLP